MEEEGGGGGELEVMVELSVEAEVDGGEGTRECCAWSGEEGSVLSADADAARRFRWRRGRG